MLDYPRSFCGFVFFGGSNVIFFLTLLFGANQRWVGCLRWLVSAGGGRWFSFCQARKYERNSFIDRLFIKGGLQGAWNKRCVELKSWKKSLNPSPLFHTPSTGLISVKRDFFSHNQNKALEDEFLQNGHFPLHRWRNSILYYMNMFHPSMFHPAIPCCFKIDAS